ncbi:MAG: cytochrome c biogenesis protein CcsA [Bacteroidota bacterium]
MCPTFLTVVSHTSNYHIQFFICKLQFMQVIKENWYKIVAIGLIGYALIYGLTASIPELPTLEQSSRNVFYHVPMWFTTVVLMCVSVVQSIKYLRQVDPDLEKKTSHPLMMDIRAREAAGLGVMFCILGLITGIIWSRVSWGAAIPSNDVSAWWVWDPSQTCALIALLIYLGYFLLRSSFNEEEQRAKIAAVYNIFAFAALIPLFFIIPRMLPGLHPTADGESTGLFDKADLTNIYRLVLWPSALGFILLGVWMYQMRSRLSIGLYKLDHMIASKTYRKREARVS